MREVIYKCNGGGCSVVQTSNHYLIVVVVNNGQIILRGFSRKLADKHPIFCSSCLHKYLASKIGEITHEKSEAPLENQ